MCRAFNYLTLLILALASPLCDAQEKLAILQFKSAGGVPEEIRSQVEQYVNDAFVNERRFVVLERSQFAALQAERFLQEAMTDEERARLNELGAQWVVVGEVNQATLSQSTLDGGTVIYEAIVAYGIRVLDVSTGQVAYSEQFSNSRGALPDMFNRLLDDKSSPGAAFRAAINKTGKDLAEFLDRAFPVIAKIVSVERAGRDGKPQEVLISKGAADGLSPRTKMLAFTTSVIEVDGRELKRERVIAELTVLRSEGDHLSVCRVTSGGEALRSKLDGEDQVYVKVK